MDNILKRESDLDQNQYEELKYDFNTSMSDDNMEIDEDVRSSSSISINNSLMKQESNVDIHKLDIASIKRESLLDFSSEIILPQASQSPHMIPTKLKKEVKSRREIEEEEREKMQYVMMKQEKYLTH